MEESPASGTRSGGQIADKSPLVRFRCTCQRRGRHALPLRAGTWYHLAAVLTYRENVGGYKWGQMDIYMDGTLKGTCGCGPITVRDSSTTPLLLGKDAASGTYFRGTLDEFRLYKRSLNQTTIQGLMWFQQGANSILVPRGLLYDSKLFAQMTGNGSALLSGPLRGVKVYANNNGASAHLNGQVIQMVLTQNTTLWGATGILALLWANKTGNVTAFPMLVTNEFFTLGLAWQVSKLVANTSVANGGNASAPPPPSSVWDQIWNTLTGIAAWAWNAAVAVAVFFYKVGKWLADAAIGLAYGLTTGNWTYFEDNVVAPFKKALEAFVKFVIDMVTAAVNWLFAPLIRAYNDALKEMSIAIAHAIDPPKITEVLSPWLYIFLSIFWIGVLAAFVAVQLILKYIVQFVPGINLIVMAIIAVITGIFVAVKLTSALGGDPALYVPSDFDRYVDWGFEISSFVIAFGLLVAAIDRGWKTIWKAAANMWLAVLSFSLLLVGDKASKDKNFEFAVFADILAAVVAAEGLFYGYPTDILGEYSLLDPIASSLDWAAIFTSHSAFAADFAKLVRGV